MEVLRTAILDMLRHKKGESFSSSDVVEQMYPQDWEQFLEEVNREVMDLYREGLIGVDWDDHQSESTIPKTTSLQIFPPKKL